MDRAPTPPLPFAVHLVTGGGTSPELALLLQSLAAARVVAFDAEWKPRRRGDPAAPARGSEGPSPDPAPAPPKFPTVTLLQVACRGGGDGGGEDGVCEVFVVDLLAVPLADLWAPLRELFERPDVLKLGFRFKQDLVYLSATFAAALGRDTGFDRVEPFLDVTNVYYYLKGYDRQKRLPKETKSLATICQELLNITLSKLISLRTSLLQVINIFDLKISEDKLMSRCTKCNGSFIQKPLTLDEAMEASKGFQVIPSCLFNRNLEFWKCTDCNQLYWEGTQYHNAVQKFLSVCNISD
ncbi:hypothetical protein PR202_ga25384 [Eleusine coracana subsp. coracana]|uniref:Mut7-C RNAse domain-containing protein n=1 Tax=Eleusine coracana subsp. coracana TaxID=191504 RepID=A0AAV5D975_ELECO|nr:hypothetical protein PR202_ga25384 [Eleusine coracana subsp. coracana]